MSPQLAQANPPDFVGYLEPNPQNKSECVVAHTVTSVRNGITTARVLNPTNQDIILREGMHLGEFFSVDESELVSLPQTQADTISTIPAASVATGVPGQSAAESTAECLVGRA